MSDTPRQRAKLPFRWPQPPMRIVLVEPEIPPNTGNIARLCAATGSSLHLIEPLGFQLTDAAMKRAGLDYWEHVDMHRHASWDHFMESVQPIRFHLFSTAGNRSLFEAGFLPGDCLVFGKETKGLPETLLQQWPDRVLGVPMQNEHVRSLNLSTTVGIALYEALRQAQ